MRKTAQTLLPLFLLVCVSGCAHRERFNKNCEWTGDSAFQLDLQNPRDREHLVQDAQLAEELSVRYADFKPMQSFGYEGHGGLLEGGQVWNDCMAKLVAIIETSHGVTPEQILDARKHRDLRFDLAAVLSFAALYSFGAMWVCRSLALRFAHDDARIWLVAVLLTSVTVSLVGIPLFELWSMMTEMIRIGNDHIGGHRAARFPWSQHVGERFIGGVLVFWLIALLRYRVPSEDDHASRDVGGPRGVILR